MTRYEHVVRYDNATAEEVAQWAKFHDNPRGDLRVLVTQDYRGEHRHWPQEAGSHREWPVGTRLQF